MKRGLLIFVLFLIIISFCYGGLLADANYYYQKKMFEKNLITTGSLYNIKEEIANLPKEEVKKEPFNMKQLSGALLYYNFGKDIDIDGIDNNLDKCKNTPFIIARLREGEEIEVNKNKIKLEGFYGNKGKPIILKINEKNKEYSSVNNPVKIKEGLTLNVIFAHYTLGERNKDGTIILFAGKTVNGDGC